MKRYITIWAVLACATLVQFYVIWWLIDPDTFTMDECSLTDVLWDAGYCSVYAMLSLALAEWIRRWIIRREVSVTRLAIHGALVAAGNLGIALTAENLQDTFWHVNDSLYWDRIFAFSLIASVLTIIYLCLYYSSAIIAQSRRNMTMQKELLKLQLDPHFVFNSLSTLTELINEDPALAESFTLKFSAIYRYIVTQLNSDTVSIADEIGVVRDYCDLLDIRHPHHFVFDIDHGLDRDGSLILPMSVQLLIENAVKHNSHSARRPLGIRVYRDGRWLVVDNECVALTGSRPATTKIGLHNLMERYALLGLEPVIERGDRFRVCLPIIDK